MPSFIVTKRERVTFWVRIDAVENEEEALKAAQEDETLDWEIDDEDVEEYEVEEVK